MSNGIQGPTGTAPRAPSTSTEATAASVGAGLAGLGTAEEVIAEASAALDKQQAMARHARRLAREGQHNAAMNRVSEMRAAATDQEIAGILGGAADVVSGGAGLASDFGAGNWVKDGAKATDGVLSMVGAGEKAAADRHSANATEYEQIAKEHGDDAQDAGDELSRAERLQDKASDHMAQMADAAMQARLAATRG